MGNMKHIIFSDIHGNIIALKKMLDATTEEIKKRYYFCGDVLGYFYWTTEVIDILSGMNNLISMRGNHDQMFLEKNGDRDALEKLRDKYGKSYLFDYTQTQIDYLNRMRIGYKAVINNKKFAFFHGTPEDYFNGRYYPDNHDILQGIAGYDVVILANTHYRLSKTQGNTHIINPGSLGLPRDGKGFSYLIYDDCSDEFEYKNVTFDVSKLYDEVLQSDDNKETKSYLLRRLREYI